MPLRKPIDRLREICLALPEATEKVAWGEPQCSASITLLYGGGSPGGLARGGNPSDGALNCVGPCGP